MRIQDALRAAVDQGVIRPKDSFFARTLHSLGHDNWTRPMLYDREGGALVGAIYGSLDPDDYKNDVRCAKHVGQAGYPLVEMKREPDGMVTFEFKNDLAGKTFVEKTEANPAWLEAQARNAGLAEGEILDRLLRQAKEHGLEKALLRAISDLLHSAGQHVQPGMYRPFAKIEATARRLAEIAAAPMRE